METQNQVKKAAIYRMVMEKHICPYGLKAVHLLHSKGFEIEDHWLRTREETDSFKAKHGVNTTPQTFIDGKRVSGYDDLRRYFGLSAPDPDAVSYVPVFVAFGTAAAMAVIAVLIGGGTPLGARTVELFISFAMMILAMLKLQDLDRFATMFLGYDLLARRWVNYAYAYPFLEWGAGALMASRRLDWLSIPVAAFIGTVGAVSVFYAVYVQRREIKCACVGGSSRVPLGFVSLSENVAMVAMAGWMLVRSM
ncbi:MAG: MauE/DoxX family redox-associated membrane protein [Novosphingobium sp.]